MAHDAAASVDAPRILNMALNLETVIIDITMQGVDRAVLVSPATPGLLVIMTSAAAIGLIGPGIGDLLRSREGIGKTAEIGVIEEHTPIPEIFQMVADADCAGFAWLEMPFGRMNVVIAVVTGQPWCDRVAKHCTKHGAPCSLDPQTPAPGYENVERRNRNV